MSPDSAAMNGEFDRSRRRCERFEYRDDRAEEYATATDDQPPSGAERKQHGERRRKTDDYDTEGHQCRAE
ncbi:hypothetical protein [Natrinema sp. 74]|uniref:hypothetical protein n=1 Tax=Natrinema sp. 74 TaxID=3384159 RepID=UPI0038D3A0E9